MAAARALGEDLGSICGGRGICGRCKVQIGEGHFAKHGLRSGPGNVSAFGAVEQRYTDKRGPLGAGMRLACQAAILGDLVIDVPADSQVHRQIVRKEAEARDIAIDPVVQLFYVEVAPPDLKSPLSDFARLTAALAAQWGQTLGRADMAVLAGLQATLRAGAWGVTVALRHDGTLVALRPGLHDRALGVALDIGSTTLALHLCDLATGQVLASRGAMNPQIRFGEDLMSRLSYAMENPGGLQDLTGAVREAAARLIAEAVAEAGATPEDVLELVAVGNPIMHHIFLGLDPCEIGVAPFTLAVDGAIDMPARDLGLAIAPGAMVHLLPCIAGHVGADAAAAILSDAPHARDEVTLLVDVGTNAEIVLGNRARLLACSSPTGPAFEGAQISCGQRATPSAIERVRIDRTTLEPRFKIVGCELWSDDPGFAAATAGIGVSGLCGSGIIEVVAEMFLAGILLPDGLIDRSLAGRSPRFRREGRGLAYVLHDGPPRLMVLQADVRAVQLAKAALHAGAALLIDRYGRAPDRIHLAGAFGSRIDPLHAMVLGLIPDCALDRVQAIGNAAGTGARIALLNLAARAEIAALVRQVEKVETAADPAFQDLFVDAMGLPHATAPTPNLARAVTLPPRLARVRTSRRPAAPENPEVPDDIPAAARAGDHRLASASPPARPGNHPVSAA